LAIFAGHFEVALHGIVRCDRGRHDGDDRQDEEEGESDHRQLVPPKLPPGI
jgi:hypothetical protein